MFRAAALLAGAATASVDAPTWFRIDEEAVGRMSEQTAEARGRQLVDALLLRSDLRLKCAINRFEVRVSETGDVLPVDSAFESRQLRDRPVSSSSLRTVSPRIRPATA